MDRNERLEQANQLLDFIASCGRRFYLHNGRVSRLELDGRGRVWFVDAYTGKRIYTHYPYDWRGFTEGGTLRQVVIQLRDYVMTGRLMIATTFGPWPGWVCDGDPWGYGEDMAKVKWKAAELGLIRLAQVPA